MVKVYTPYERKIADASKAWRHYEWICSDEHAQYEEDRRINIAGHGIGGRPGVPLEVQKKRARKEYVDALSSLRRYEAQEQKEQMPEKQVKAFVEEVNPNKGRKRGGRALALQKYIRRIQRQIDETREAPAEDFKDQGGPGRPKMSRASKIRNFELMIEKAHKELLEVYREMDDKERLWHEMHDLKTDRRQLKLALANPENPQSLRIWRQYGERQLISEELQNVNAQISRKEAQIKMLDAGIPIPKDQREEDFDSPAKLEEYRRSLEYMIKEQTKIRELEQKAKELGIDVEKLKGNFGYKAPAQHALNDRDTDLWAELKEFFNQDEDMLKSWLDESVPALSSTPRKLLESHEGREEIRSYLERVRHGDFS